MEFVEVADSADLADGAMRAVDVGGKRVLLALVEGQTYAIGAVCTHERAFLDQGALEGHEVYCPRHFSCFDVRTGEALEPPADRPTPVYAVKVSDGKVLVSAEPVEAGKEGLATSEAEPAPEPAAKEQPPADPRREEQPAAEPAAEEEQPAEPAAEEEEERPAEPAAEEERAAEPAAEEPSGAKPAPEPAADAAAAAGEGGEGAVPAPEPEPAVAADATTDGGSATQPSPAPQRPARVRPRLAPAGPAAWQQRLLELAEDLPIVENGAEALGAAIQPFRESRAGRRVFDLLHGRLLGHALHPALSDLPIGFWSASVLLDTLGEHRAAGVLSGAGVAAGVATAVTGVADWTVSDGRDRRTGLVHGVLQTAALGLHAASLAARGADRVGIARTLGATGTAVSTGSAYLGGHLVFGRGVMVDHTAWHGGPRAWTRAIREDELADGQTKAVAVDSRTVLFSRTDGVVSAIDGVCSHAGGPLGRGKVAEGVVSCPWHGSCFRVSDGTVVRGPASHPQPILETRATTDGWIEVRGRRR